MFPHGFLLLELQPLAGRTLHADNRIEAKVRPIVPVDCHFKVPSAAAYDSVEVLAALKANGQIDLVVTDINMPRMDGLSQLQKLQENEI